MSPNNESLSKRLRAARRQLGLSQKEVSELSGIPQSRISLIERGDIDCRVSTLMAMARAVKLDLTVVPAVAMPAVTALVNGVLANKHRQALPAKLPGTGLPAYRLDDEEAEDDEQENQDGVEDPSND